MEQFEKSNSPKTSLIIKLETSRTFIFVTVPRSFINISIFSWGVVAFLTPVASPFLYIHYFPYYFFLGDGGGGTFEKRGISPCISGL